MKLLKVGHRYINLDLVTDILVDNNGIYVFLAATPLVAPDAMGFSAPNIEQGVRALRFFDEEAQMFQQWLDKNAEDADPASRPPFRPATAGPRS